MALSRDRDHIVNVELHAFAGVEFADAIINIITERFEFFEVLQDLPTDVVLFGFRKPRDLRHRLLQRVGHDTEYSKPPPKNNLPLVSGARPTQIETPARGGGFSEGACPKC